jgi:hypothetical protein
MNNIIILRLDIPRDLSLDEYNEKLDYYRKIQSKLNEKSDDTIFEIIFVPSDKNNISVLYPNITLTKKELIKVIDE